MLMLMVTIIIDDSKAVDTLIMNHKLVNYCRCFMDYLRRLHCSCPSLFRKSWWLSGCELKDKKKSPLMSCSCGMSAEVRLEICRSVQSRTCHWFEEHRLIANYPWNRIIYAPLLNVAQCCIESLSASVSSKLFFS